MIGISFPHLLSERMREYVNHTSITQRACQLSFATTIKAVNQANRPDQSEAPSLSPDLDYCKLHCTKTRRNLCIVIHRLICALDEKVNA